MKRHCLALDLKDDPFLISEYKRYHQAVWPEIKASLRDTGILDMEIYCLGARLFMVIETTDDFSFETKAAADAANPKVQEWETLMGQFQQPLADSQPGAKWVPMERVFKLDES